MSWIGKTMGEYNAGARWSSFTFLQQSLIVGVWAGCLGGCAGILALLFFLNTFRWGPGR